MVLTLFMCILYWSSNFEMRRQIERTVIILGNSLNQIFRSSHSRCVLEYWFPSRLAKSMENVGGGVSFLLLIEIKLLYPYLFRAFSKILGAAIFQEQLWCCRNSSEVYSAEPKRVLQNRCPVLVVKSTSLQNKYFL